jgi:ABC-type nitrate/sulfonate/bicarbonate transport system substrate-binding protein
LQAQFAGIFAAKQKGFFKAEGINAEIVNQVKVAKRIPVHCT